LCRNSNQKNAKRLEGYFDHPKFNLYYADFAKDNITEAFRDVDMVVHFGAKTFVDYSIRDPSPFIESNVVGTYKILEEVRKSNTVEKYFQISTDEVYGAILNGKYKEDARPNPTNPYAATKMAADSLVLSYHNSYGIDAIITRTENNYGEYQGPEKVFPVFIKKALRNEPLPIYGDGLHRRMWLYVEDHCTAIIHLASKGKAGEIYHVAGEEELTNIELGKKILCLLNKPEDMFVLIPDHNIRPGHDRRYALDCEKIKKTGWEAKWGIDRGFEKTVKWYSDNNWWFM
jgi:dTDP-glucose 4,6-dehydratase